MSISLERVPGSVCQRGIIDEESDRDLSEKPLPGMVLHNHDNDYGGIFLYIAGTHGGPKLYNHSDDCNCCLAW